MNDSLVQVNKVGNIKLLPVYKRIVTDYPIFLRKSVLKKLISVSERLPSETYLQIDSGFRTIEDQRALWQRRFVQFRKELPNFSDEKVENITNKLVSNPKKEVPPHSTGGAVDVSLIDKHGRELNLSEPYEKYYDEPELRSKKITRKAQKLRLILNKLMLEEEFCPNPQEYWHFSYGDNAWAKYYKKKVYYKNITLERKMYYSFIKRLCFKFMKRYYSYFIKKLGLKVNYLF